MGRVLVTPPTEEPITLEEAKLHLRVESEQEEEDALILGLVKAARAFVENETGRAMLTQTWRVYLDRFPTRFYRDTAITLPVVPVQSITSVSYYNEAGVLTVFPGGSYVVDLASEMGRIVTGVSIAWPSTYDIPNAVVVELVAGYPNVGAIPAPLVAAMKLLIGHWYESRESVVVGTSAMAIPLGVDALLAPYRMLAVA